MEALMPIIVQAITGILGGQAVGAAISSAVMGQVPKILSGAIGGIGGATILGSLLGGADPAAVSEGALNLNNILGGAGGGAILTAIVGQIMKAMNK